LDQLKVIQSIKIRKDPFQLLIETISTKNLREASQVEFWIMDSRNVFDFGQ